MLNFNDKLMLIIKYMANNALANIEFSDFWIGYAIEDQEVKLTFISNDMDKRIREEFIYYVLSNHCHCEMGKARRRAESGVSTISIPHEEATNILCGILGRNAQQQLKSWEADWSEAAKQRSTGTSKITRETTLNAAIDQHQASSSYASLNLLPQQSAQQYHSIAQHSLTPSYSASQHSSPQYHSYTAEQWPPHHPMQPTASSSMPAPQYAATQQPYPSNISAQVRGSHNNSAAGPSYGFSPTQQLPFQTYQQQSFPSLSTHTTQQHLTESSYQQQNAPSTSYMQSPSSLIMPPPPSRMPAMQQHSRTGSIRSSNAPAGPSQLFFTEQNHGHAQPMSSQTSTQTPSIAQRLSKKSNQCMVEMNRVFSYLIEKYNTSNPEYKITIDPGLIASGECKQLVSYEITKSLKDGKPAFALKFEIVDLLVHDVTTGEILSTETQNPHQITSQYVAKFKDFLDTNDANAGTDADGEKNILVFGCQRLPFVLYQLKYITHNDYKAYGNAFLEAFKMGPHELSELRKQKKLEAYDVLQDHKMTIFSIQAERNGGLNQNAQEFQRNIQPNLDALYKLVGSDQPIDTGVQSEIQEIIQARKNWLNEQDKSSGIFSMIFQTSAKERHGKEFKALENLEEAINSFIDILAQTNGSRPALHPTSRQYKR